MNVTSIGDLAQNLLLRSRSAQLKTSIATLTEELSTGRKQDITTRLGGDLSHLTDIENNLSRLEAYSIATREAGSFANAAQLQLERLQRVVAGTANTLTTAGLTNVAEGHSRMGSRARAALETAIETLNAGLAGRSIFAGNATDQVPLGSAQTLMDGLRNELAGLTDAQDIAQAAKTWFDDPGGFRALIYAGSDQSLRAVEIGAGERVSMPLRADDAAFRDVLRNLAVASLVEDPALGLDGQNKNRLLRDAGASLMSADLRLTEIRADLGFSEARIQEATTRNAAARTGLVQARGALIDADPFETATRLEEVRFQLESLYTVTVRTSRLSLLEYLR